MKWGATLKTERLIIRDWTDADRSAFHRLNSDEAVMAFFPLRRSRKEADALLDYILDVNEKRGYGWGAVCLAHTNEAIGFSGIAPVDYFEAPFGPAIEIGWRILPEHWHKGYATESAAALLEHAFQTLEIPRIVAFSVHDNHASIKVMQRIGMVAEPALDFDHPNVPNTHPHLKRHVFYAANRP